MKRLIKRIVRYALKVLNKMNERFIKEDEKCEEIKWANKFEKTGYLNFEMQFGVTIRLYKDSILSKMIYYGFENEELEFTFNFLRKGDIFFDIGANIGLFSLVAAKRIGETGKIFAFEPSPKTFLRLKENIVLNKFENIIPLNLGLSNKIEKLPFNISETGYDAWNSFAGNGSELLQKSIEVPVITLESFISEKKLSNIQLFKIDVEGWEKFVLLGGEKYLRINSPVIILELTESNTFSAGYMVQELYSLLESWGYCWYRLVKGEFIFETKRLHYPYDNLIATKNIDFIYSRLKGNIN